MTHVVTDNCRGCRYTDCVASCPVACFHVNEVRVYIDPAVCIDCSACIPACPVHAIVEEFDLAASSIPPPTWAYLTSLEWIRASENLAAELIEVLKTEGDKA